MVDRRVIEKDAAALTGLRIKAARVLTSLNQEAFAEKFKFGYASVKNWELGRSIPREDTVGKILDALSDSGVQTTRDWLLFGLGSGPNHISDSEESAQSPMAKSDALDFTNEVAQFERVSIRNGIKPLVVTVADELMQPFFSRGDILGAESIELKSLASRNSSVVEYPYLVEIAPSIFQPRLLSYDQHSTIKFWRTNKDSTIGEIKHGWLGRIIWFRRPSKCSVMNSDA